MLLGPKGSILLQRALQEAEKIARRDGIPLSPEVQLLKVVLLGAAQKAVTTANGRSALPLLREVQSFKRPPGRVAVDPIGTVEAADLLGCQPRNVRDLCRRGVFVSAAQLGRSWTIERAEIELRALSKQTAGIPAGSEDGEVA